MAIRAAVDGLGVCLDSMLLAEQELRAGSLVVVLPETAQSIRGHAMVVLRSRIHAEKIEAFTSWMFRELEQTEAWWTRTLAPPD